MSTSLLYHAFGIVGYFYQSTRFIAGTIVVAIQADKWRLRCPVCRSRDVHRAAPAPPPRVLLAIAPHLEFDRTPKFLLTSPEFVY